LCTAVYACDIGSVKSGAFAWARNDSLNNAPTASGDIDDLITNIVNDVASGATISLGFEAPLFLPVPDDSTCLNSGRTGELNRSMFAPPGATVTTIAIHETAWILKRLQLALQPQPTLTLDWESNWQAPGQLFIWEAFVSSNAHSDTHERDAATAVQYFLDNIDDLSAANAVTCENPLSLVAATAIWSGWLSDIQTLHLPCLVLKPTQPYNGRIDPA